MKASHDPRRRSKRTLRTCTSALPLVVALLFAPGTPASETGARITRIAGSDWVVDAPTKVADALGYFNPDDADSGDTIRVDHYHSGQEALQQLLRGEAEFALAATTPVAIALLGQVDAALAVPEIVILASVGLSNQSHYIVAARDRGIKVPHDLLGKRIGLMRDTSGHYGWSRFAGFHGLADAAITLIDVPVDRHRNALHDGTVDAVVSWDPWAAGVRESLGDNAVTFSTRQVYTVNWLLLTRPDTARHLPVLTDRVLRGYLRAIELIRADPEQARRLHSQVGGVPVEALAQQDRHVIWNLGLNWSVLANMEAQFDWLATRPELADRPRPTPDRYLEGEPLARVAPRHLMLPPYLHADPTDRITEP